MRVRDTYFPFSKPRGLPFGTRLTAGGAIVGTPAGARREGDRLTSDQVHPPLHYGFSGRSHRVGFGVT